MWWILSQHWSGSYRQAGCNWNLWVSKPVLTCVLCLTVQSHMPACRAQEYTKAGSLEGFWGKVLKLCLLNGKTQLRQRTAQKSLNFEITSPHTNVAERKAQCTQCRLLNIVSSQVGSSFVFTAELIFIQETNFELCDMLHYPAVNSHKKICTLWLFLEVVSNNTRVGCDI